MASTSRKIALIKKHCFHWLAEKHVPAEDKPASTISSGLLSEKMEENGFQ